MLLHHPHISLNIPKTQARPAQPMTAVRCTWTRLQANPADALSDMNHVRHLPGAHTPDLHAVHRMHRSKQRMCCWSARGPLRLWVSCRLLTYAQHDIRMSALPPPDPRHESTGTLDR